MSRIALVDDHPVFRLGLRLMLEQRGHKVVAELGNAKSALEATLDVQVYVVDIELPGVDGITLTRELLRQNPRTRVLVLSFHDDSDHAARALFAGAAGYAWKGDSMEATLEAVAQVAEGGSWISPSMAGRVFVTPTSPRPSAGLAALSQRERQVFDLVVRGLPGREIARTLSISAKTVESHRYKINRKLGTTSVAELVRFAALSGHAIL